MKKLALSAVLLAAFSPLLLAGQTERISLFDSYVTVNADGSMLVCETIEVQANRIIEVMVVLMINSMRVIARRGERQRWRCGQAVGFIGSSPVLSHYQPR